MITFGVIDVGNILCEYPSIEVSVTKCPDPSAIAHRARQITSGVFIRRHSLKSASSVQSSIKKLLSFGLVSFDNGEYFIADQLMGLWLQK